jgi:hypothetical protein
MIFEDQVLLDQGDVLSLLTMPVNLKEIELEYRWHAKWNHLGGTTASTLGIEAREINSPAVLEEALSFARSVELEAAVIFIDMRFANVQISPEQCTKGFSNFYNSVDDAILSDGAAEAAARCAASLATTNRHGLLLAYAFVTNALIRNVDVWLASGVAETDSLVKTLQKYADTCERGVRIFNANGSIARSAAAEENGPARIAERFHKAFDTFAGRFRSVNLWPTAVAQFTDLADWFRKTDAPEHACHQFEEIKPAHRATYRNALSAYLTQITGRTHYPDIWFEDKGLHETLKRIVGADAFADKGQKLPSLGAIALLAAAAEKTKSCVPPIDEDWLMRFVFPTSVTVPIIHSALERSEVRRALMNLHAFLEQLMPANSNGKSPIVAGVWERRGSNNIDHLELTLRLDCLTPDIGRDHALLEKLTNLKWWCPDGGTTQAYKNFRDSFCPETDKAKLAVSIYPRGGKNEMTCLDFKALSDP